ncbi:hypothetical protein KQX54_002930 [Cotesia glomerata]|uniref:Uncharacterized protein n=1 Tax=Cotesia glomerata TaxID=32391 RepID=A0AAV7IU88_COTGL|nr:hypothetical protein KQX54_002930 [Cotesia glomerata]
MNPTCLSSCEQSFEQERWVEDRQVEMVAGEQFEWKEKPGDLISRVSPSLSVLRRDPYDSKLAAYGHCSRGLFRRRAVQSDSQSEFRFSTDQDTYWISGTRIRLFVDRGSRMRMQYSVVLSTSETTGVTRVL